METVTNTLEYVKTSLEKKDEDLANRSPYFSKAEEAKAEADKVNGNEVAIVDAQLEPAKEQSLDKFQKVSFELLDIGVYYGEKTAGKVRSLPLYQSVDGMLNLEDKFGMVANYGQNLFTFLDNKFRPLIQHVFFLYDSATNTVTSYINVITTKQQKVQTYVTETYTVCNINISGTWMRLDFNNDGSVSVDDLKKSMVQLYDFLRNFDIIEATTTIKSKLYTDAISYMQAELEEDQKKKVSKGTAAIQGSPAQEDVSKADNNIDGVN